MEEKQPQTEYYFVSTALAGAGALASIDERIDQLKEYLRAYPNNVDIRFALANANLHKGIAHIKMAQDEFQRLSVTSHGLLAKRYMERINIMLNEAFSVGDVDLNKNM